MKNDIERTLAQLRSLVEHARSMPMSTSVVVNKGDLFAALEAVEAAVDAGLTDATAVVGDRDAVVAAGRTEADELLERAREEREKLVSDTDVYRLAVQRADELTLVAQREADELRAETDQYVEDKLANFELSLERTLEAVQRGRARLTGGHAAGLGESHPVEDLPLPEHLRRH